MVTILRTVDAMRYGVARNPDRLVTNLKWLNNNRPVEGVIDKLLGDQCL